MGSFKVIPAVDIKDGRCVRLVQGDVNRQTVYYDDPAQAALKWADMGATRLHLVDLDGAFEGKPVNVDTIQRIRGAVDMEIELGGGIRTLDDIALYVDSGINKIILGTGAYADRQMVKDALERFGADRIIVGADGRDGMVAIKGWVEKTSVGLIDFVKDLVADGVEEFIVTDVSTDGMLGGPNIELYRNMLEQVKCRLIASGGLSCAKDIENLLELVPDGLCGCIAGKALYDGRLDFNALSPDCK